MPEDSNDLGGIVGYSRGNSLIKQCSNYGNINNSALIMGGIAGYTNMCIVEECYNLGTITGKTNLGGIVGETTYTTVKNCYNIGKISGTYMLGGIIGTVLPYEYSEGYEYLYNCYNLGLITGKTNKDCWVGSSSYLTWDHLYTIKTIQDQVGYATWNNEFGNKNFEALSGTDENIKSTMLTNLLKENGAGKWTRDTTGKINNGYPYLVNNKP